jgi:hypothetical protein
MHSPLAAILGLGLIFGLAIFLLIFAVGLYVVYLVYQALLGLPESRRPMDAKLVWLMLIPFFNLYWIFRIFPPMMKAYQEALTAKKQPVEGDGGQNLALGYCICSVCSIVPGLGGLAFLASLVLFVLVMVKAYDHKRRLAAV